jgi:nitrate/nitrite transporter NarK
MFGSFTGYWTAVAYELVDHHHLTQNGVAVFALVGAAGAATAPVAGRLGDAGHSVRARIVALVVAIVAMGWRDSERPTSCCSPWRVSSSTSPSRATRC